MGKVGEFRFASSKLLDVRHGFMSGEVILLRGCRLTEPIPAGEEASSFLRGPDTPTPLYFSSKVFHLKEMAVDPIQGS